jgi:hypothetical protein
MPAAVALTVNTASLAPPKEVVELLNVMLVAEPPLETLALPPVPDLLQVHVADWLQVIVTLAFRMPKSLSDCGAPAEAPPLGEKATSDVPKNFDMEIVPDAGTAPLTPEVLPGTLAPPA